MRWTSAVVTIALGGCGVGVGSMSATSRPLLGRKTVLAEDWTDGCTEHVSTNFYTNTRTITSICGEPVHYTGLDRVSRWVGMGGGWRRGPVDYTLNNVRRSSTTNEIDATVIGHLPLKWAAVSVGATYVMILETGGLLTGAGFRGSVAPLPQFSIDAAFTWLDGYVYDGNNNRIDVSGTRMSFGGSVMLYGLASTRLAVAVARVSTDTGPYQSQGYTYQLVYTLY